MKKLLLLSGLLLSLVSNAQWDTHYYVDEFGDNTKDSYDSFVAEGTFSNSATRDSKALYKFMHNKRDETISIKVYEYARSLATDTETSFTVIKIKTPSKEVVEIKSVMFSKTGAIYFYKKSYKKLLETISSPGDYIMVFERTGKYSSADSYKATFTMD
tara:strand:- start:829 stop:1302 length:474 start_codon:yes stop_codon:yes gene_type:complete